MHDKLIKLLEKARWQESFDAVFSSIDDILDMPKGREYIVDYLLENGVIVPPCKVGQTVFRIVKLYGDRTPIIVEGEVFEIALTHENGEIKKRFYFWEKGADRIINRYSLWCEFDDFGKSVFPTKEEAEQALKGGEG